MMKNGNKPGRTGRSPLKGIMSVFATSDGPRAGWILICAVVLYRLVGYGLRLGLNADFAHLFSAWRVSQANIHLAPHWAQLIWSWHGSIITVTVCAVSVCLSLVMRGWWMKKRRIATGIRPGLAWGGLGAGIAVASSALFVLFDSMRFEWPITEPDFSVSIVMMLPVTLFTAFSEELFTKGVVFDLAADRMKRIWAYVISAGAFFLFNGGYAGTLVCSVNVLLMGVVCCMLYARRGLWAAVLFRGMWSYVAVFILGFGVSGTTQSVYAMYSVSEAWLTGGDGGMIYGVWMTVLLLGIGAWMHRRAIAEFIHKIRKCAVRNRPS